MAIDETVWPEEYFLDLDRSGPMPLYYQVSSRIEAAIRAGALPSGARLENEIAIAERLGLSRPTIRRAMQELVDRGLLVRRRGIGTQVVQGGQFSRQVQLTSLYEDLKSAHHEPSTEVLDHRVMPASQIVVKSLGVPADSDIVYIQRLRKTDGVPVALLQNYLPIEFADVTRAQLVDRGLYQILRSRGVTIRIANQKIGARRASKEEVKFLGLERGGPVLTMERVAFENSGRAIEFGHHSYRPDLYDFETTLVAK